MRLTTDDLRRKYERYFKLDDISLDDYEDNSVFADARKNDTEAYRYLLKVAEDTALQELFRFLGPNQKCRIYRLLNGHLEEFFGLVQIALSKCLRTFKESLGETFKKQLKGFTYYFRRYLCEETKAFNKRYNKENETCSIEDMADRKVWDAEESKVEDIYEDDSSDIDLLEPSWKKFIQLCREEPSLKPNGNRGVHPIDVFIDYYIFGKEDSEIREERGISQVTLRDWRKRIIDFVKDNKDNMKFPLLPEDLEQILRIQPKWARKYE
jgi:hypothetical protein